MLVINSWNKLLISIVLSNALYVGFKIDAHSLFFVSKNSNLESVRQFQIGLGEALVRPKQNMVRAL